MRIKIFVLFLLISSSKNFEIPDIDFDNYEDIDVNNEIVIETNNQELKPTWSDILKEYDIIDIEEDTLNDENEIELRTVFNVSTFEVLNSSISIDNIKTENVSASENILVLNSSILVLNENVRNETEITKNNTLNYDYEYDLNNIEYTNKEISNETETFINETRTISIPEVKNLSIEINNISVENENSFLFLNETQKTDTQIIENFTNYQKFEEEEYENKEFVSDVIEENVETIESRVEFEYKEKINSSFDYFLNESTLILLNESTYSTIINLTTPNVQLVHEKKDENDDLKISEFVNLNNSTQRKIDVSDLFSYTLNNNSNFFDNVSALDNNSNSFHNVSELDFEYEDIYNIDDSTNITLEINQKNVLIKYENSTFDDYIDLEFNTFSNYSNVNSSNVSNENDKSDFVEELLNRIEKSLIKYSNNTNLTKTRSEVNENRHNFTNIYEKKVDTIKQATNELYKNNTRIIIHVKITPIEQKSQIAKIQVQFQRRNVSKNIDAGNIFIMNLS